MINKKFSSKWINILKYDYPELYETIIDLDKCVFTGKSLDPKTQKLIAIGIVASNYNSESIERQMRKGIKEFSLTKDELMDVLRVVLLTSGMPTFTKSITILNELF
ncbi:MAG: carboxymuconolactone decarboxylase family protein [archaeon]|nr:carboxymuconolactone decarboxylase family protein [archaeon]